MVFEIRSEPSAQEDETRVRASIERVLPKLRRWGTILRPVVVKVAPTHHDLVRAVGRPDHTWLRAWATANELIVQSPATWAKSDVALDELVLHELSHCLLFQNSSLEDDAEMRQIPFWFREGLATVIAEQGPHFPSLEDLSAWLRGAQGSDVFRDAEERSRHDFRNVYGLSFHAMRFLFRRYRDDAVVRTMELLKAGMHFNDAFRDAVGMTPRQFESDFLNFVRFRGYRGFGLSPSPKSEREEPLPAEATTP
jgi:hypothetical protein